VLYELFQPSQTPNGGAVCRSSPRHLYPPGRRGTTEKLQSRPPVCVEADDGSDTVVRAFGEPYLRKPFEVGVAIHKQSLGRGRPPRLLRETTIIRSTMTGAWGRPGALRDSKRMTAVTRCRRQAGYCNTYSTLRVHAARCGRVYLGEDMAAERFTAAGVYGVLISNQASLRSSVAAPSTPRWGHYRRRGTFHFAYYRSIPP
jgi:hypothetical protein